MPELPRVDQDINFEVRGISCIMELDTTAFSMYPGDIWIIKSKNANDAPSFGQIIETVFEHLEGFDADGCSVRVPRQRYSYFVDHEHGCANLMVEADKDEMTLACGIFSELPDWDGEHFNIMGRHRVEKLFDDFRDAVPGIKFTRSDESAVSFEGKNSLDTLMSGLDELLDMFRELDEETEGKERVVF